MSKIKQKKGFTLVELLVVMSIIGVLASLIAGGFRTAQMRGRDAQRKSDLKEIANSLELFFADHGQYPPDSGGVIAGCSYDPVAGTGSPCTWGTGEFTDSNTVYFKQLPLDPESSYYYVYRVVPSSGNQKYQLFARLENSRDKNCLNGDCANPPIAISCGALTCNFAVTSANTNATE